MKGMQSYSKTVPVSYIYVCRHFFANDRFLLAPHTMVQTMCKNTMYALDENKKTFKCIGLEEGESKMHTRRDILHRTTSMKDELTK